jgi:predicted  nucleic acid-binding Zn-ribbon protein
MDTRTPEMIAEEEKRMREFKKDFLKQTENMTVAHDRIQELEREVDNWRNKAMNRQLEIQRLRTALEQANNLYAGLCESAIDHTLNEYRVSGKVLAKLGEVLQQALESTP